VPDLGLWGRCNSIFDTNCDGGQDGPTAVGDYDRRMIVREAAIDPAANGGAQYFAESWYVVRDDVDIYSTMGHLVVLPAWDGSFNAWEIPATGAMTLGPVINRWVNPAAPGANASNVELDAAEGHVRVAVRVTAVGGGSFRYDYAVMNFDFARAVTQGAEPNLRVLSNRGFSAFRVTANASSISAITFSDGDSAPGNNWNGVAGSGQVTWTAPAGASLDWGTLFLFSFVANAPPLPAPVTLTVADPGSPASYQVNAFAAAEAPMFANGFENP